MSTHGRDENDASLNRSKQSKQNRQARGQDPKGQTAKEDGACS